jgi:hypothetical protein
VADPIVVSIPHRLGQAEAQRRVVEAFDKGRIEFGRLFSETEVSWRANHADLRVVALKQTVTAGVDVFEDSARIEVRLPWYFAPIQKKIVAVLTKRGESMLTQIAPPGR